MYKSLDLKVLAFFFKETVLTAVQSRTQLCVCVKMVVDYIIIHRNDVL